MKVCRGSARPSAQKLLRAEMARPVIANARRWWGKVWPDNSHEVIHYSECADRTAALFLGQPESNPLILACARNRTNSRGW